MEDLRILTAKVALNKLFKQGHFSICVVRELAELFNVLPNPEAMRLLQPLHCINYADMPAELYTKLPEIVQTALAGTPVFQFEVRKEDAKFALEMAPAMEAEKKPSFLKRFLGHDSR